MTQYIDKDAVVAEIKRRIQLVSDPILSGDDLMIGERNALFNLLSFLNTLEVKEVDLEKEIENYIYTLPYSKTGIPNGWKHSWSRENVEKIAKHFFELGIKERRIV